MVKGEKKRKKNKDPWSAYKKEHAKFGHTYKLLAETIEKYGRDMMCDKQYNVVYRGIEYYQNLKVPLSRVLHQHRQQKHGQLLLYFGSDDAELHPDERMQGIGVDMEPFLNIP